MKEERGVHPDAAERLVTDQTTGGKRLQRDSGSSPIRILLVEDQRNLRNAIAAELEADPGFELVGQAGSLAEARAMLAGADVALLDLGLPDGSGADLIPELRDTNPETPVIVLSASFDPSEHEQARANGAIAVLDKLQHLGQLVPAVRQILARERARAQAIGNRHRRSAAPANRRSPPVRQPSRP
jgi:DNA-binding NarL/FixJ family response regulator